MRRWCIAVMLAMCVGALFSCSDEREDLNVRMADSLKITAYVLNSDLEGKGYWKYDGTHEHKNRGYWVSDDGKEHADDEVFVKERLANRESSRRSATTIRRT